MYAAYHDTVDDEGEDESAAIAEAENTLRGTYGTIVWDASFVTVDGENFTSASVVTLHDPVVPLVAFTMTRPENQRLGLATRVLSSSLRALHQQGYAQARLVVTAENTPAVRLYTKLGFVVEQGSS